MDDGPYWVTLLKYGSHGMRHRFSQVNDGQQDPRVLGCHKKPQLEIAILVFNKAAIINRIFSLKMKP